MWTEFVGALARRRPGAPALALLLAVLCLAAGPGFGSEGAGVARSPWPSTTAAQLLPSLHAAADSQYLWRTRQGFPTAQAREVIRLLSRAGDEGLDPADYDAPFLQETAAHLSSGAESFDAWQRFDDRLSLACARLVHDLHYGRINPTAAGFDLHRRADLDLRSVILQLSTTGDVAGALASLEPPFYHYGLLKRALARYRALEADPLITTLPPAGTRALHAGDAYTATRALRYRLRAEGDLPAGEPEPERDRLDAALVQALQRFQARHGLAATGVLDPSALKALNTPLRQRVRQIELTLERWRWLPAWAAPSIVVNIPEFRLFAFPGPSDRVDGMLQMAVIVGRSYLRTRTPVFIGSLNEVVFRPYWDVPADIAREEMLPAIRRQSDYLQRHHLEIVSGAAPDISALPPSESTLAALATGRARLRQLPGEDNALGLVKFLFPNSYNVYLHDTPTRELFRRARRDVSHGCIRVEDPAALAAFVLRNEPGGWDKDRIRAALEGTRTVSVRLTRPETVLILYGTALATEAGPVQFFDDLYGHDARLEKLLNLQPVPRTASMSDAALNSSPTRARGLASTPADLAHAAGLGS